MIDQNNDMCVKYGCMCDGSGGRAGHAGVSQALRSVMKKAVSGAGGIFVVEGVEIETAAGGWEIWE